MQSECSAGVEHPPSILQHLVDDLEETRVNYFVVGAANFIENSRAHEQDVPAGSLKFFWAGSMVFGGFGLIEVNRTQMNFAFIDRSEKTLYQTTMQPRFWSLIECTLPLPVIQRLSQWLNKLDWLFSTSSYSMNRPPDDVGTVCGQLLIIRASTSVPCTSFRMHIK